MCCKFESQRSLEVSLSQVEAGHAFTIHVPKLTKEAGNDAETERPHETDVIECTAFVNLGEGDCRDNHHLGQIRTESDARSCLPWGETMGGANLMFVFVPRLFIASLVCN